MSRKLAWLLLFAFGSVAHAAPGGFVPTAASHAVLDVNRLESVVPPALDLARLGEEDVARDRRGCRRASPFRSGFPSPPTNSGTWEDLGNGQMLWRLRILGREGTTSLNLGFTRFKLPPSGRLLLYSADGSQVSPAFTAADNEAHGELWTPVVTTNDLIVELTVPRSETRRSSWSSAGSTRATAASERSPPTPTTSPAAATWTSSAWPPATPGASRCGRWA